MIEYLPKKEIIYINKRTIQAHGGNFVLPFNLLNEGPLDYLVDIVKSEIFGSEVYPSISLDTLYEFTIKVATGILTLEEVQAWFEQNVTEEYL